MQHALYAPSSMAQTVQCPASVRLQRQYPEQPDESTIEGEAAHWACAELLHGRPVAVGQITSAGVELDDDMIDAAELYASVVRPDLPGLHVESAVRMPRIHAQCWGTPDAWRRDAIATVDEFGRMWIRGFDFKYGHEYVDEWENWQLICYAAGMIEALGLDGLAELSVWFSLTIVQPRAYGHRPVRTWEISAADLRAYWNIAAAACEAADKPDAPAVVGPACKHCSARHACDALNRASLSRLDAASHAAPLDLDTPTAAAELRRIRYALEILQARGSGLEQQLMHAARIGEQVPGFHIEHSNGREAWQIPFEQVIALGTMYSADLRQRKAITPKQARDAGVLTDGFTERKAGAASLVVDQPHRMVRIFSQGS